VRDLTVTIKPLPPAESLREWLRYEPETGLLFWIKATRKTAVGDRAFTYLDPKGYFWGGVCGAKYPAHRVIWKMMTGLDPFHIDHIDGNSKNNRFENLRSVNPTANHRNRRMSSNNTSGVNGVVARGDKWRAFIGLNDKIVVLGHFDTVEEATAARRGAEKVLGYSETHGRLSALQNKGAA
jgi:hypothetical protein